MMEASERSFKLYEAERNKYAAVPAEELITRIKAIKSKYGSRLLILGHLYQKSEIVALSDLQGDSFQLSAVAAKAADCEAIVFCGVHFMAETADILANCPSQRARRGGKRVEVILPDPLAGCAMADMATRIEVESCWQKLQSIIDVQEVIPVTYVNSTAELKAFCGRHGGIACTSTNAAAVLKWAFAHGKRVLFFPDQHLGRNTAFTMGLTNTDMIVWNHRNPHLLYELQQLNKPEPAFDDSLFGGNTAEAVQRSRIILWNGFCPVHQHFTPEDIERCRKEDPKAKVIVHPECCQEVVRLADDAGSTSMIMKAVDQGAADASWYIGTEFHLVERVANIEIEKKTLQETNCKESNCKESNRKISNLSPEPQLCPTMNRIDLPKLCWTLERWDSHQEVPLVQVEEEIAADALICLERMLSCP